jgi:hypothetical protein
MLINAEDPYQDLLEEFEKIKPWKRGGKKRKKEKKKRRTSFYFTLGGVEGGGVNFFSPSFCFTLSIVSASMSVFSRYMNVVTVNKRGYSGVR